MKTISKELCVKIWNCHDQIENSQEIINKMGESVEKAKGEERPTISNAFGDKVGLQLGVPSGSSSHRIYGVNTEMGIKVLKNHIKEQKKKLKELNAQAKIILNSKKITNN